MRTTTALTLIATATVTASLAIPSIAHAASTSDLIPDSLSAEHVADLRAVVDQIVPDTDVSIRFDGDEACPEDSLGCVTSSQPTVIHIVASRYDPSSPDSLDLLAHEAAHVAAHVRGIEIPAAFEGMPSIRDSPVPPGEAFADCAAIAVTGGSGFYVSECPDELQVLALDLIR